MTLAVDLGHKATKQTNKPRSLENGIYLLNMEFENYIENHVLLNLLKEFRKRSKMLDLLNVLWLFYSKLNKFNNTEAQMLDSIYHITLKVPVLGNHVLFSYCENQLTVHPKMY